MRRAAFFVAGAAAALAIGFAPAPASAQVGDSGLVGLRKAIRAVVPDSERPPISARRAFLSSFVLPGYGQSRLGRPRAAMLFSVIEVLSLGMTMKAEQDLHEAKGAPKDSVVNFYTLQGSTQVPGGSYIKSRFNSDRVNARRLHYEDWIAALVFNHLLAGADAYVAANLWDFRANVGATASTSSVRVTASLAW
jgi:hypothetical protein